MPPLVTNKNTHNDVNCGFKDLQRSINNHINAGGEETDGHILTDTPAWEGNSSEFSSDWFL